MMTLRACVVVVLLALGLISVRLRFQETGNVLAADERTALVEGLAARCALPVASLLGLLLLTVHWLSPLQLDHIEMGLMAVVLAPALIYTVVFARAGTARSAESPHFGFLPRAGRTLIALAAAFWLWFGVASAASGGVPPPGWVLYLVPGTTMTGAAILSGRYPLPAGLVAAVLGLIPLLAAACIDRNPLGLVLIGLPMLAGGILLAGWSR